MKHYREWVRQKVRVSGIREGIYPQGFERQPNSIIGASRLPAPSLPQLLGSAGLRSVAMVLGAALSFGVSSSLWHRSEESLSPDRYVEDPAHKIRKSGRRWREIEWKKINMAELRQRYEGSWVVLEGDQVVSHGADPVQVVKEAREKGARNPYVFFVDRRRQDVAWLGL